MPKQGDSPYMLMVAPVVANKREPGIKKQLEGLEGLDLLHAKRSVIPAVTHVDYSARVQTVDEKSNPRYYRLLQKFFSKTGCPVLVNTSFNIRGEPIICNAEDAYRCFMGTFMDALMLENILLLKDQQPNANQFDIEAYRSQFPLD